MIKRVIIYVNHTIQKMQYQLHDGIFTCALYKNYVPFDQEFFQVIIMTIGFNLIH